MTLYDAIGGEDQPDMADPETTIAYLHRKLDRAEAVVAALSRQVRRTPFEIVPGGITVFLSFEQLAEQQASLRAYEDADKVADG